MPFYLLLAVIFVYALFPFYWALRSSFTPEGDLFRTRCSTSRSIRRSTTSERCFERRVPGRAAQLHHRRRRGDPALALAIGSFAAYALGRFRFRGRSATLYLMLSMTIFPQIAILGALYTMINRFGLYNSLGALVFSYMIFTLPFTVWVLTSFMRALPEGSRGGRLRRRRLAAPGLLPGDAAARRPGLVTTGLLAFIAAWNEFLYALSFTQTPDKRTVPVAILSFTGESGSAFQTALGPDHGRDRHRDACRSIVLTLVLQRRILAGPDRRRRQGLVARSRAWSPGRRSRAGSCRPRARPRCRP